MKRIEEVLSDDIRSVAIAGHVNPDGDCTGSCCALYLYLKRHFPGISELDLYLENVTPELRFLKGADESLKEAIPGKCYDLIIICDTSEYSRIAVAQELFDLAKRRVSIDHHITNRNYADVNHIIPGASSCAEVLADLFDMDVVDRDIAECLYTGIITDCGVFQYSNTSPDTLRTAALLMEKGVDFSRIINETFNERTVSQNRILAYCLETAKLYADGKCIAASVSEEVMERYGVTRQDIGGVVSMLNHTKDAEVAVFVYPAGEHEFKVSLRSSYYIDVSAVAASFGGGGHVRAAGCTIAGTEKSVVETVTKRISEMLSC
jgi:phosphoesterase RecJ-like protein